MRVTVTQMGHEGKPLEIQQDNEGWSGWHFHAIVSAIMNDMRKMPEDDRPDEAYLTHLEAWLTSGDDIDIMYLKTPYGLDIWQYDDESED